MGLQDLAGQILRSYKTQILDIIIYYRYYLSIMKSQITVMKYNKQTNEVTDISRIFQKLETSVQEASVSSFKNGEGI